MTAASVSFEIEKTLHYILGDKTKAFVSLFLRIQILNQITFTIRSINVVHHSFNDHRSCQICQASMLRILSDVTRKPHRKNVLGLKELGYNLWITRRLGIF